jgi:hypothetical protein
MIFTVARFIGLLLIVISLIGAFFFSFLTWYIYYVIGGTLFLSSFNKSSSTSFLNELIHNRKRLAFTYGSFLLAAISIDAIGKFFLGWWHYNEALGVRDQLLHVYLLGYPFCLFMVYETWLLIKRQIKPFWFAFITTTLVSAFIHEYPNTFVYEWRYTIPGFSFEIFNIHIVVIIGWSILVAIPLVVTSVIAKKYNSPTF